MGTYTKSNMTIKQRNKREETIVSKDNQKSVNIKKQNRLDRQNLLLWKRPFKTLYYFTCEIFQLLIDYGYKLVTFKLFWPLPILIALTYHYESQIPIIHQNLKQIETITSTSLYWIILGILSSVGLGTGLHTFLLYLGPFIAKVTLAAYECQTTNFNQETYPDNIKCPIGDYQPMTITIFTIMAKVRLEALMWGFGTAIGELPPYFMARAASLASKTDKNLDSDDEDDKFKQEMKEALEEADTTTLFGKGKQFMNNLVNKAGFFGILLAASIPNPLFDLAGITCGHFLIPFWTFFGATSIGKAIVKMHIQLIFIIFLFSKHHVESLIALMKPVPKIQQIFKEFTDKQKENLYHGKVSDDQDSGLLGKLMGGLVSCMILYFLVSIINSLAQARLKKIQSGKLKRS